MAVVDGQSRVRSIDGLRIADASVMPTISVFMLFFGAGMVIIVDARTTFAVDAFGLGGGVVCLVLGNYFGLTEFAFASGIAIAINPASPEPVVA